MGVALGGSGLTMPEHLADEIEAVAARHGDRGEAVPKVMNADIPEPGRPPDTLPGLLDADEMSVAALGGQNVRAALLSWQLRNSREALMPRAAECGTEQPGSHFAGPRASAHLKRFDAIAWPTFMALVRTASPTLPLRY
jgi:hypothetical protein